MYQRVAEAALEGPRRPPAHDLGAPAPELPPERRAALFGFVGMFQLFVFLVSGMLALAFKWHRGARRSLIMSWSVVPKQRWVLVVILSGIAILGLAAEFVAPPDPDNAFLLYAAGRVLDGAKLYVDIVEINPPLIIAFNFPPILIARLIGVSELLVFRIGVACLLGLSLLASQVGLRAIFSPSATERYAPP